MAQIKAFSLKITLQRRAFTKSMWAMIAQRTQSVWSNKKAWPQMLFWLVSFGYLLGLYAYQNDFAKLGLSLPADVVGGDIAFQKAKIYITEIYIFFCALLALFFYAPALKRRILTVRDIGSLIALLLLAIGLVYILAQIGQNPLLVIRNSAFTWYLIFPLLISALPFAKKDFEQFSRILTIGALLYSSFYLALSVIAGRTDTHWSPFFGALPFVVVALLEKKMWPIYLAAFNLSFNMGFEFQFRIQRTIWVGLLIGIPILAWHLNPAKKTVGKFLLLFAIGFLASYQSYKIPLLRGGEITRPSGLKNPWIKAETSDSGIELFRYYQWNDAWEKFRAHPILGIGMRDQAVTRIYVGSNSFIPNTGGWEHPDSPPISGPHNSYLNAIVRIGFLGSLFLILHLFCFCVLLGQRFYYCAAILLTSILYSFFNIGLEGPTRSFALLFELGVALNISQDKKIFQIQNIVSLIKRKLLPSTSNAHTPRP